jgi:hypothetical protein
MAQTKKNLLAKKKSSFQGFFFVREFNKNYFRNHFFKVNAKTMGVVVVGE